MGITVTLEKEDGTQLSKIEDAGNLLHRVLPAPENSSFIWAGTIDWYGDTTFNYLQAGKLRDEWKKLIRQSKDAETSNVLNQIGKLLDRCTLERHLYIKFYGD